MLTLAFSLLFNNSLCWSRLSCSLATSLLLSPRRCSSLSILWCRWDKSCRNKNKVLGYERFYFETTLFAIPGKKTQHADVSPPPRVQEALPARAQAPASASDPASGTETSAPRRRLHWQLRSTASSSSSLRKSQKSPSALTLEHRSAAENTEIQSRGLRLSIYLKNITATSKSLTCCTYNL